MLIKQREYGCLTILEKSIKDKKHSEWIFEFDLKVKIHFILEYFGFGNCAFDEWKSI